MMSNKSTYQLCSASDLNVDSELIHALEVFSRTLALYNINILPTSVRSLDQLSQLTIERKTQLTSLYKNWNLWIQPQDSLSTLTSVEIEKACLKRALDYYNLEMSDEFWQTIEKDQIIEIYGQDMVQLYRSFSFFGITGYSLLDISVFEWFVLWNRPTKAIQETANDLKEVIENYIPAKKFQISKQIIQESFCTKDEGFIPRTILADFKYAGSLTTKNCTKKSVIGFVCSSTAEVIAYGENSSNLFFI